MMECVEDCSGIKFEHGPLFILKDSLPQLDHSPLANCTYLYSADALVYLTREGLRGITLKEFLSETTQHSDEQNEPLNIAVNHSKTYTLCSSETRNFFSPDMMGYSCVNFRLNQNQTYGSFSVSPSGPNPQSFQIIVAQWNPSTASFRFFKKINVERKRSATFLSDSFGVKDMQWSCCDDLILQDTDHSLYRVSCRENGTAMTVSLDVMSLDFPVTVAQFRTSVMQQFAYLGQNFPSGHTRRAVFSKTNVVLAAGSTAGLDHLYAAFSTESGASLCQGEPKIQKIATTVIKEQLKEILDDPQLTDLSKFCVMNLSPVSLSGLDWVITFFYRDDQENTDNEDSEECPDVFHAFVTLSKSLSCVETCHAIAFNEIQIFLKKRASGQQLPTTSVASAIPISSFFLFSSCAPDIVLVSSLRELMPADVSSSQQTFMAVKPPEAFQISCEQLDFERHVGCRDILYVQRYPLAVIRSHASLDTSLIMNPGLILVLQTDGVVACHYVDCIASTRESSSFMYDTLVEEQIALPSENTNRSSSFSVVAESIEETSKERLYDGPNTSETFASNGEIEGCDAMVGVMPKAIIDEILCSEDPRPRHKEVRFLLAQGLSAYEAEVKGLEESLGKKIPEDQLHLADLCFQHSNLLQTEILSISQELQEHRTSLLCTLQNDFKSLLEHHVCNTSQIRRVLSFSLNSLNDLVSKNGIKKSNLFTPDPASYRRTLQDCLNFMTLMDHTRQVVNVSLTSLALEEEKMEEMKGEKDLDSLKHEIVRCKHRTMSLLSSALALMDVVVSRVHSLKRHVGETMHTARSSKVQNENGVRRYALNYALLDSVNESCQPRNSSRSTALCMDCLDAKDSFSVHQDHTLHVIDSVHDRLRKMQLDIRQLKYKLSAVSFIHSKIPRESIVGLEATASLLPSFPLPRLVNELFVEDRMFEKGNASLLFDFVQKGLMMSMKFLQVFSSDEKSSFLGEADSRQKYFDHLRESVEALKIRQQHLEEDQDQFSTLLSKMLPEENDTPKKHSWDGDSSELFSRGLFSPGDFNACFQKACAKETSKPSKEETQTPLSGASWTVDRGFMAEKSRGDNIEAKTQVEEQHGRDATGVEQMENQQVTLNTQDGVTMKVYGEGAPITDCAEPNIKGKEEGSTEGKITVEEPSEEKMSHEPRRNDWNVLESVKEEVVQDKSSQHESTSEMCLNDSEQDDVCVSVAPILPEISTVSMDSKDAKSVPVNQVLENNLEDNLTNLSQLTSQPCEGFFLNQPPNSLQQSAIQFDSSSKNSLTGDQQRNGPSSSFFGSSSTLPTSDLFQNSAFERKQYTFGLDSSLGTTTQQNVSSSGGVSQASWAESLTQLASVKQGSLSDRARDITGSSNPFLTVMKSPNALQPGVRSSLETGSFGVSKDTSFPSCSPFESTGHDTSKAPVPFPGNSGTSGPFGTISSGFGQIVQDTSGGASSFNLSSLFSGPTSVNVGNFRIPDALN